MDNELALADPARIEAAERIFSKYKTMTPEEWAARYSHTVWCSDFDSYQYPNEQLHKWIQRLHEILKNESKNISSYRRKYLSPEEIERIEAELNDPDRF